MSEEKRYPIIEEEDGSCLTAHEPAVLQASKQDPVEEGIDYNYGFHDFGYPRTIEELKIEIDEAEAHRDDPDYWISSEQMWADIKQEFPWANIR